MNDIAATKTDNMKKVLLFLLTISVVSASSFSQEKRLGIEFTAGIGGFTESVSTDNPDSEFDRPRPGGISTKAKLSVSRRIGKRWAVNVGTELNLCGPLGESFYETDNINEDAFLFLRFPVTVQYHTGAEPLSQKHHFIVALGTSLNLALLQGEYDTEDNAVYRYLDGKKKSRKTDIGIVAGIYYQMGKHGVGVECNYGLANIARYYGGEHVKKHVFTIAPVYRLCF